MLHFVFVLMAAGLFALSSGRWEVFGLGLGCEIVSQTIRARINSPDHWLGRHFPALITVGCIIGMISARLFART